MIVTLTTQQANYLATLARQAEQAKAAYAQALGLLTLGHDVPADASNVDINTDTGVLTFSQPPLVIGPDAD